VRRWWGVQQRGGGGVYSNAVRTRRDRADTALQLLRASASAYLDDETDESHNNEPCCDGLEDLEVLCTARHALHNVCRG
jgi:hypothetical protein